MRVFIGNLPGKATLVEIKQLIGEHEMSFDVSTHKAMRADGRESYFVLAKANDSASAEDLIAKLHGTSFQGSAIEARHFVERRATSGPWEQAERRVNQLELALG